MKCPHVYDYRDYRLFLKDLFYYRKQKNNYFSYRYFAKKAGFVSPNFLKLVTEGKRNLTNTSIAKIAKGFGLKKLEREFFESLVFMNQATSHEEKNHYYKKMMAMNGANPIHKLEKESFDYFSKWYYPVIREIVMFGDRKYSPEQIASFLNPKISVKEVKKALGLLMKLGLIEKNTTGHWEQSDRVVSPRPGVKSLVITNFHKEMLRLARESAAAFNKRFLGQTLPVLWEQQTDGLWNGLTGNYIRVYIRSDEDFTNRITDAKLENLYKDGVMASSNR